MFLDIGVGILLTFFFGSVFNIEPSALIFLLGIIFALLPDFDMVLLLLPRESRIKKFLGGHRGITHRPFVYLIAAPFVFYFFGIYIGSMFIAGILWHFLHDSFFLGWGIKWFWPVSQRSFMFFPVKDGKITNQAIISWLPEEEESIRSDYGDPNWVRNFYLKFHPISFVEYFVFLVSVAYLVFYFW